MAIPFRGRCCFVLATLVASTNGYAVRRAALALGNHRRKCGLFAPVVRRLSRDILKLTTKEARDPILAALLTNVDRLRRPLPTGVAVAGRLHPQLRAIPQLVRISGCLGDSSVRPRSSLSFGRTWTSCSLAKNRCAISALGSTGTPEQFNEYFQQDMQAMAEFRSDQCGAARRSKRSRRARPRRPVPCTSAHRDIFIEWDLKPDWRRRLEERPP